MITQRKDKGFTVTEILVTLFVAALFAIAGWQLYAVVTARSSEARQDSEASNIAYSVLRGWNGIDSYSSAPSCSSAPAQNPVTPKPPTGSLPEPVNIVVSRCDPIAGIKMNRVVITVKYGEQQREVSHGIFVSE